MDKLIAELVNFQFTAAQIAAVKDAMTPTTVEANTLLVEPDTVCTQLYYILEGSFVCRKRHDRSGSMKTINFFLDNLHPFMLCVDSYFTEARTSCELRAVHKSQILHITKNQINQLITTDVKFLEFYNQLLVTALLETVEMKQKLISLKPVELYADMLDHFPQIIQRVPSYYIAEYIGVSPEWLSKIKKRNFDKV